MFSSKDLSKISGFLGKKARALNFLVSNLLVPTQHPRTSVHVSFFLFFKCVFYLTLTLPLSLSLWGGFLHVYNSFFVGWREIKGKDENAYGQFSRAL